MSVVCMTCRKEFPTVLALRAHAGGMDTPPLIPRVSKDEAPCCLARRDGLGRLPVGYCSPSCVRRPGGDAA